MTFRTHLKNPVTLGIAAATVVAVLVVIGLICAVKFPDIPCNVAYIKLQGQLVPYIPVSESASSTQSSDQVSSEDVTQAIRQASANTDIKAIILAIDSPGGSPVGGEEIESTLKEAHKPTVALIRSMGDSAAYMSATGADTIFASTFSDVGDIGITQSYVDNSKQDVSNGLTYNQLSVGAYKDMFSTDKPLTSAEKTLAMKELYIDYDRFVQIVSENRHMSLDTATTLANGSSVAGTEALQDGLIDKIGNVDDVRTYLQGLLGRDAVICSIDADR